jgi:fatty acid kinase fatty acid binding subunit
MAVRIVTDSACDLTRDEAEALGVEVVPLTIRFGDEEFVDGVELSVEDFYSRMASTPELPQTAAPAPGAFEAAFRRGVDGGADAIVCINLSAQLSATMQSAQTAAKAFDGTADVRVIDSRSVTSGLGSVVRWASEQASAGADADTIVGGVEDLARRQRIWATLDTMDNLKKGGRVGGAKAFMATLLSIKPAISVHDGKVEEAGKPRTRKKALQWLADKVLAETAVEHLHVMHGQAPDLDELLDLLAPKYGPDDLRVGLIGPVIGTHGGPRVIGITYHLPA